MIATGRLVLPSSRRAAAASIPTSFARDSVATSTRSIGTVSWSVVNFAIAKAPSASTTQALGRAPPTDAPLPMRRDRAATSRSSIGVLAKRRRSARSARRGTGGHEMRKRLPFRVLGSGEHPGVSGHRRRPGSRTPSTPAARPVGGDPGPTSPVCRRRPAAESAALPLSAVADVKNGAADNGIAGESANPIGSFNQASV